jgi:pterin-4a-carbinolamine dehydratase
VDKHGDWQLPTGNLICAAWGHAAFKGGEAVAGLVLGVGGRTCDVGAVVKDSLNHDSSDGSQQLGAGSDAVGTERLTGAALAEVLRTQLTLWTRVESPLPEDPSVMREELYRVLRFRSFADAIGFMALVAPGCDRLDHHPRWENVYRDVRVYLSTWDGGVPGVSGRDVRLAQYFDRMFAEFAGAEET